MPNPRRRPARASPADEHAPRETDWSLDDGYGSFSGQDGDDDSEAPQAAAEPAKLRDHLLDQINLMQMPDRDKRIVAFLIDNLDDDGYMTQDLVELAALLPVELEIDSEQLTIGLKYLQSLDPPGVGARNLSECLALQLEALPEDTPYRQEASLVVTQHLDVFAARDYFRLKKLLRCDDEVLRTIQALIIGLNPRPAANFSGSETRYIIPDVVVRKTKGMWVTALNPEAMPKLRINRMYADILHRNRDASFQQLAGQLQEAKWLIKNVQQRFDTILRVSQAIVDRQRHFFEHGEVAMRPLVLREIAETLGLHESTDLARHDAEVHADATRDFRTQVFLRQSRFHRNRRRLFRDRHPRADQADGRRRRHAQAVERQPDLRGARQTGHHGGAPHHCEVPGISADSSGQSP